MADALQLHKYVVKNIAKQAGKSATFLPKPIFEENGSGMHVHQSLWKDGDNAHARRQTATGCCRRWRSTTRRACSSTRRR